jgi:hypothetical protein
MDSQWPSVSEDGAKIYQMNFKVRALENGEETSFDVSAQLEASRDNRPQLM